MDISNLIANIAGLVAIISALAAAIRWLRWLYCRRLRRRHQTPQTPLLHQKGISYLLQTHLFPAHRSVLPPLCGKTCWEA